MMRALYIESLLYEYVKELSENLKKEVGNVEDLSIGREGGNKATSNLT